MSDLIRRDEAIVAACLSTTRDSATDKIKEIPTAEPKVGKWKAKSFHECFCDNCGFSFDIMKCDFLGNMKHCPNCGAKMEGREE